MTRPARLWMLVALQSKRGHIYDGSTAPSEREWRKRKARHRIAVASRRRNRGV